MKRDEIIAAVSDIGSQPHEENYKLMQERDSLKAQVEELKSIHDYRLLKNTYQIP